MRTRRRRAPEGDVAHEAPAPQPRSSNEGERHVVEVQGYRLSVTSHWCGLHAIVIWAPINGRALSRVHGPGATLFHGYAPPHVAVQLGEDLLRALAEAGA